MHRLGKEKLSRLGVIADQFGTKLVPYSIYLLPSALSWTIEANRPEVKRTGVVHLMKQVALLADRPEIHAIRMEDLKDKVVSIRSPTSFLVKSPR